MKRDYFGRLWILKTLFAAKKVLSLCVVLIMGILLVSQTAHTAEPKRDKWNTYQPDVQALETRCISSKDLDWNTPGESETNRIVTYSVRFSEPGTYDLYARLKNGTMFLNRSFGRDYQWQKVQGIKAPQDQYTWVNLSEEMKSNRRGDLTYAVDVPGTKVLSIANRRRGARIDAFAFGLADKTFTDEQLSAAAEGSTSNGLVGFQAENATSFGNTVLTETGQALRDSYAQLLNKMRKEIRAQLPQISDEKKQACIDALKAEKYIRLRAGDEKRALRRGGIERRMRDLQSTQEKLDDAENRLADAKMLLKNALAMPESDYKADAVEWAQKKVEARTKELKKMPRKLEKAKAALEQARKKEAELQENLEAAVKVVDEARDRQIQAYRNLGIDELLSSDALDAKLAKYGVISQTTPYRLAAYAQQGAEQKKVVDDLLNDSDLMIQMMVADGPVEDKFIQAAEIYYNIQSADPKAKDGLFHRLALAVALEHAEPIRLDFPEAAGEEPQYVDPVQRYQSYKQAYLAGELDPSFEEQSAWSLRMVVNGDEPGEISAWGRKMLRNYRPDLITMDDEDWRYVKSVNTEINYTSKFQKMGWDRPDLQNYQNILANGGICGRRAFFGRFILRAFGIPSTARSQPGHAALVRFTPDGWVPCLGAGWGASNRTIFHHYPTDRDFLASTQAREDKQSFMQVKRAQWIGVVRGEEPEFGYRSNVRGKNRKKALNKSVEEQEVPEFWHSVAMIKQNMIVAALKAEEREAVGEDLGESNEAEIKDKIDTVEIPAAERKIVVDSNGIIHIPAVATSQPTDNTDVIRFMPSNLGGWQLHYTRFGGADTFAYTFEAPKAGKYHLTARVVTPAPKQHLFLKVNDADARVDIALPYTIGMWRELKPVEIELEKGKNELTFYRGQYFQRGVTIRDFNLVPVK